MYMHVEHAIVKIVKTTRRTYESVVYCVLDPVVIVVPMVREVCSRAVSWMC